MNHNFIQAIRNNEPQAILVYADYLEEQGDPQTDFLRDEHKVAGLWTVVCEKHGVSDGYGYGYGYGCGDGCGDGYGDGYGDGDGRGCGFGFGRGYGDISICASGGDFKQLKVL